MQYPSSYLAIDETLYPYCGTNGIKQYKRSRPGKYWLLCKSLQESTISHTCFTLPYAGKPNNVGSDEASKFYISGTHEYTKCLVTETSKCYKVERD